MFLYIGRERRGALARPPPLSPPTSTPNLRNQCSFSPPFLVCVFFETLLWWLVCGQRLCALHARTTRACLFGANPKRLPSPPLFLHNRVLGSKLFPCIFLIGCADVPTGER